VVVEESKSWNVQTSPGRQETFGLYHRLKKKKLKETEIESMVKRYFYRIFKILFDLLWSF